MEEDDIWIGDTGASAHLKKSMKGVEVNKKNGIRAVISASGALKVECEGSFRCQHVHKDGKEGMKMNIQNIKVAPNSSVNLFSITKAMKDGWELKGKGPGMSLTKGNAVLTFDIEVKT